MNTVDVQQQMELEKELEKFVPAEFSSFCIELDQLKKQASPTQKSEKEPFGGEEKIPLFSSFSEVPIQSSSYRKKKIRKQEND